MESFPLTLAEWHENGWLQAIPASAEEVARLLAVADRNLADAEVTAVSTDARVGFAHAATVALAAAALAAEGYRAGKERHHERLLDSLRYTIDIDARLLKQLHDVRRARNALTYEQPGDTTQAEAEAIIWRAGGVRVSVMEWLRARHGELVIE